MKTLFRRGAWALTALLFASSAFAQATKVVFLQQPTATVAGQTISPSVTVQLQTAGSVNDSTAGVNVTLTLTSGTGPLNGTLIRATDANGLATFNDLSINFAGSKQITASSTGLTSDVSSSFNITAASATKLIIIQQPTAALAGASISPSITVQLRDQFDNDVAQNNVSVAMALSSGTGTLSGTTPRLTNASGVATFNDLSIDLVGSKQLTASSGALTTAVSSSFAISAGAATQVRVETLANGTGVTVPAQNVTSGSSLTVYAIRRDQFGNFVDNVAATAWSLQGITGGVVAGNLVPAGDARSAVFTGALIGTAQIRATSAALTAVQSGTLTVLPGTASKLVITGSGTQTAGTTQNLTITARDPAGNTATGYVGAKNLTFSGANPSISPVLQPYVRGATSSDTIAFGQQTSITFTSGVATVGGGNNGVMRLYRAESATIAVTDGTISASGADRLSVTVSAGALGKFAVALTSPQSGGVAFAGTNTITAQDDWGNTVTTFNASSNNVTVVANAPLVGTITGLGSGNTNVLNQAGNFVSGVANLTGEMIYTGTSGAGTFGVTSASPAKAGTSNSVTIGSGAATRLVITGKSTVAAGDTVRLTITARDAGGNIATGYTGSKSLTFSGANPSTNPVTQPTVTNSSGTAIALGAATAITFTNGIATVSGSSNGVLRPYRVESALIAVTDGTLSSTGSDRLTLGVTEGPLGKFVLALATPQSSGAAFTGTNTLTAQDDYGNVVTAFNASTNNVTLTENSPLSGTILGLGGSGAVLNLAGDFVSGVANLAGRLTYFGIAGTGTFTATSTSAPAKAGTSGSVVVNAGSARRLVITGRTTIASGDTVRMTVTARDSAGNVATTYAGTKSLTFSGASASIAPVTQPSVVNNAGAAVSFGQSTALTFASGVASASSTTNGILRLFRAEGAVVAATDGTIASTGADRLSVTVGAGALGKFALTLATPQMSGSSFTGTNTLTAQDDWGNTTTTFEADANNVTLTSSLTGTISGLGSLGNNVLNRASDFTNGVASLTGALRFTGTGGTGTFTATSSAAPARTGTSGSVVINNPPPAIISIAPTLASRGRTYDIGVTGANFVSGVTTVDFGTGITVNSLVIDSTAHFTANVTIGLTAAVGARGVSVTNAGPGGGSTTLPGALTVDNLPSISGIAPPSGLKGQSYSLVFTGTNFVDGSSSVSVTGGPGGNTAITIQGWTVNSPTQMTVGIAIAANAEAGPRDFFVRNPGSYPSGGSSDTYAFSVGNNPAPDISTVAPAVGERLQSLELTVRGNDFYTGITSLDLGSGITITSTTIDSVTKLRATVAIAAGAATGPRNVAVLNGLPGGGRDSLVNAFTVRNPAPTLSGISVTSGNRLQTMPVTIVGTKFIGGVTTLSFGTGIQVSALTVDSAAQMRATITIDSSALLGAHDVFVTNPAPGGGADTLKGAFTVNNPGSGLTSISPTAKNLGDTAFTLTLNGASFVPGSIARFDSTALTTTFVNTTRLTALVPASLLDTAKVFAVTVANPGAGVSNAFSFTVNNPAPTLTSVAPDSARRLDTVNVVLTGTGFVPGFSTIQSTPSGDLVVVSIQYTSPTSLTARVVVAPAATAGNKSVSVVNPGPGGGISAARIFRVTGNPAPTVSAIAPGAVTRLQKVDIGVTGTRFIAGVTTVSFGAGVTVGQTTVDSATHLTASVTVAPTASTGTRGVTVTNAAPGGGTASLNGVLTITNPMPALSSLSPANGEQFQNFTISFRGANFLQGVTSIDMGTGITINSITVVAETVMAVNVTITATAALGPRDINVFNSAPGGGFVTLTNGFVVGQNPPPSITSISPASGERLQVVPLVIRGTSFLGGITTVNLGPNITVSSVTVDSATRLTANVIIGPGAGTGLRDVYVVNQPPGGGADTLAQGFSVVNPAPLLASLTPSRGSLQQTLDIIIRGGKYIGGVTTADFGGGIVVNTLTVASDSVMTANITVGSAAQTGLRNVTIVNASPGGGTSSSVPFTVEYPATVPPALLVPADGATGILTVLSLRWNAQPGAIGYRLQIATNSSFTSPVVDDTTGTDTTRQVGPLALNTAYYWRLAARFGFGLGAYSDARSFRTLAYPPTWPVSTSVSFPSRTNASEYPASEYRLIGLPGASNTPVRNLFGGSQNVDWQVYWDTGDPVQSTGLLRFDGSSTFVFGPGRGFWAIKKGPWTVNTSVPTATLDTSGSVLIPLHSGWNIITNPFAGSIDWSKIQAANPTLPVEPIWSYNGSFAQSAAFAPYSGYYFMNSGGSTNLRVPFSAVGALPKESPVPPEGAWEVAIHLQCGELSDFSARFGVVPGSSVEKDPRDYHKPRALGVQPTVQFDRPAWDDRFPVFATDMRPDVRDLEVWSMTVRGPARQEMALRFDGVDGVPPGLTVMLLDVDRARSQDLREKPDYRFTSVATAGSFRIAVGTREAVQQEADRLLPKEYALGNNYPNPFNPSTTIPVAVPRVGVIALKVYNVLGEEVRTLFEGPVEAGRHWFTWDGRNNAGASVASGVYLTKFTVDAHTALVRKMILMK